MSAEDNKAASRRFYEEVIHQKQLAVIDEVAGDNYHSHDFPPGLPPGREGLPPRSPHLANAPWIFFHMMGCPGAVYCASRRTRGGVARWCFSCATSRADFKTKNVPLREEGFSVGNGPITHIFHWHMQ